MGMMRPEYLDPGLALLKVELESAGAVIDRCVCVCAFPAVSGSEWLVVS